MSKIVFKDIYNERAFHVLGWKSYERSRDDKQVLNAISQAKKFIKKFPKGLDEPSVSGGLLARPNNVLSFYWNAFAKSPNSIEAHVKMNGKWDLKLSTSRKHEHLFNDINLSEVLSEIENHNSFAKFTN